MLTMSRGLLGAVIATAVALVASACASTAAPTTGPSRQPSPTPAGAIGTATPPVVFQPAPASTIVSSPTPTDAGRPTGAMPTLQLTQARNAASADLSKKQGIPSGEIGLYSSERVDWPDSSLGNPQPGYAYSQVVTPGWRLVLFARGTRYEYHTNLDGTALTYLSSSPLPPNFTPAPQNY